MKERIEKDEQLLAEQNEERKQETCDEAFRALTLEDGNENEYPVLAFRGQVAFPLVSITIEASRALTIRAIELAYESPDREILVCAQKDPQKTDVNEGDLFEVGTVVRIDKIHRTASGTLRILGRGLFRARAQSFCIKKGCFHAVAERMSDLVPEEGDKEFRAHARVLNELVKEVLAETGKLNEKASKELDFENDTEKAIHTVVTEMRVRIDVKQQILQAQSITEQMMILERCLNDEKEISAIERKIALSVKKSIDKSQKEYFLNEQMKAIQKELGGDLDEAEQYAEKVKNKHLPPVMEEKCLKEIERMKKMHSSSPEYTVVTGYLDQVLELPWTEQTADTEKLADCVKILNEDHYGLEEIKERVTEYLAVLKLKQDMKAPILCLVGPPGVGKTSIAQSVARALGRKFVRMSLGGVKDEAEIRGHRRTYIGSMPGRVLYAMKTAGTLNPVFLLDEIDKVSSDMRGDPASALLEVLDPEQNNSFRDRYLEEAYDLSKVLFIATANTVDTIPAPLLDRMEIIRLSGYTTEEKTEIAKRYLVPKQLKANGLCAEDASFKVEALRTVIEGYTMEAGVRTLERTVGTLCRKIAMQKANNPEIGKITVDKKKAEELLGAPKYLKEKGRKKAETGAVTGLAWTAVGGATLTVEATTVAGKGEIRLTGKLGDVMKESALTAITYIRSHAEKYGINAEAFDKTDIHIHVPEGATPKDGPSAGITIATAVLSVFTGKKARADIAMTGEITLRGKVLAIGGLKEKALAARRQGIKTVIVPEENLRDVEKIPETVRKDITFIPVSEVDEVFKKAFAD